MFYEETWINGELHWRGTPTGEWIKADVEKLNVRLRDEQKRVRGLQDAYNNMRDWAERNGVNTVAASV